MDAKKRGLPNLSNTVDALPALVSKKNISLLEKFNVLSPREMESRCEIYLERYVKDVAVESRLTLEIAKTTIFPAAVKYQNELASTALALKQGGYDWGGLAYAVGFGGSMIWFGSSAGVALSNSYPESKSVVLRARR